MLDYVIVSKEVITVNGNNKVYDLYLELAKIKYNKNEKKRLINNYLDKLFDIDINISYKIIDYLDELDRNYNIDSD